MHQSKIKIKRAGGECHEYVVTFTDDTPQRTEAVGFFLKCGCHMHPRRGRVDFLDGLSQEEAQRYLDLHPMPRLWGTLVIQDRANLVDMDLRRLEYLPELEVLHVFEKKITDYGIAHCCHLKELKRLLIYSELVTDSCFAALGGLAQLEALDMQQASHVSGEAFRSFAQTLPKLREVYPPNGADPKKAKGHES